MPWQKQGGRDLMTFSSNRVLVLVGSSTTKHGDSKNHLLWQYNFQNPMPKQHYVFIWCVWKCWRSRNGNFHGKITDKPARLKVRYFQTNPCYEGLLVIIYLFLGFLSDSTCGSFCKLMAANFEVSWFPGCFNNSRLKAGHSNAERVDHATWPKRNMVGIHYQTQTIWVN